MYALWLSLRESVKCVNKLAADVIAQPERRNPHKYYFKSEMENLNYNLVHHIPTPIRELIYRESYTRTLLYELDARDISRNIIEMIFKKASLNPSKPSTKIKSILKVKNSIQSLERFEKYREKVKRMANEKHMVRHPRSKVDGNELLRFYGTTIACRSGKSKGVSELCTNSSCGVCSLLQSNFDAEYALKNGVELSTSSEVFSEKISMIERMQKIKRAVIVCRIIAGNMTDVNFEEYNEYGDKGPNSYSENLILHNPSAVLPCFVVVFA